MARGFQMGLLRKVVGCLVVGAALGSVSPASADVAPPPSAGSPTQPASASSPPSEAVGAAGVRADTATAPARFEAPRRNRIVFWGLVAGAFLISCAAVGANDRPRGDGKPGAKPMTKSGGASPPPGYRAA